MHNKPEVEGYRKVIKGALWQEVMKISDIMEVRLAERYRITEIVDTIQSLRKNNNQIQTIKFVTIMRKNILLAKKFEPFDLIRK